jgi:hypothetical protein
VASHSLVLLPRGGEKTHKNTGSRGQPEKNPKKGLKNTCRWWLRDPLGRKPNDRRFATDESPRFKDATVCKAYLVGCCPLDAPLGDAVKRSGMIFHGKWKNRCGEWWRHCFKIVWKVLGRDFCQFLPQIFSGTCRSVSLQWPSVGLPGRCWAASANLQSVRSALGLWKLPGWLIFDQSLTNFDPWRSNAKGKTMRNHNHSLVFPWPHFDETQLFGVGTRF